MVHNLSITGRRIKMTTEGLTKKFKEYLSKIDIDEDDIDIQKLSSNLAKIAQKYHIIYLAELEKENARLESKCKNYLGMVNSSIKEDSRIKQNIIKVLKKYDAQYVPPRADLFYDKTIPPIKLSHELILNEIIQGDLK
jgi:uncharacterized membrane protein YgaE (UPF0421/DUF939 family)